MHLCVVRHGETDHNVQNRYAGSTDVPLNATGLVQAEQLAEMLKGSSFDLIITSPLLRARKTAEIINSWLCLPLVVVNEFTERNVGVYEGLTQEEVKSQYPELYARRCTRQPDDAPAGGETYREFDVRVSTALEELRAAYANKRVLLVCHSREARIIHKFYNGLSYDEMHEFSLGNCEVVEYTA